MKAKRMALLVAAVEILAASWPCSSEPSSLTTADSISPANSLAQIAVSPLDSACDPNPHLGSPTVADGVPSLGEIFRPMAIDTKWEQLPDTTKAALQAHADARLATFRNQWAKEALRAKEHALIDCPTPAMTVAIDAYFKLAPDSVVPNAFVMSRDVKYPALWHAMIRAYLNDYAALRATIHYPEGKFPLLDWDGASTFDSMRLPDAQAYEDIKAHASSVASDLRAIPDKKLSALESSIKQYLLYEQRAHAVGAFSSDSYGGEDMVSPCARTAMGYDILSGYELDKTTPKIYRDPEAVLQDANALHFGAPLKWTDVGTVKTAVEYCAYDDDDKVKREIGDPATNDVAKGYILMRNWWVERLQASASAKTKCTIYSATDRKQIWDAFSADQKFNNDGSIAMETYKTQLSAYNRRLAKKYQDTAIAALQVIFPNENVITAQQRARVVARIRTETAFGSMSDRIASHLDAATGATIASTQFRSEIKKRVVYIGGYPDSNAEVSKADIDVLTEMFGQVKTFLISRYSDLPIDIPGLLTKVKFSVVNKSNADTVYPAEIHIGIATARSKAEYYSWIIHELRHAVYHAWRANALDKSQVKYDEGPVLEGSGVAAESLLLEPFLRQTLNDKGLYELYALDYGIRDARFVATTAATLEKYFRAACDGNAPDTIAFARSIAEKWGLTGQKADTVATRAHAGTQYFQYIYGGIAVSSAIANLQAEIDPSNTKRIDPFILFACGLNTPKQDAAYKKALKACVKL